MSKSYALVTFIAVLAVNGCSSDTEILKNDQDNAINVAVQRG